jgi:hypothetical protein
MDLTLDVEDYKLNVRAAGVIIHNGKILVHRNVTVECNPLLGPQIMETAKKLAAGQTVPKWIKSNEGIYRMNQAKKELPNRKY